MAYFNIKNSQSGQILLVVVLAAVVSLTVGLSAVSRSITNTRVTTEEANSNKALSAAESGVEELLKNGATPITKNFSNNSGFIAKTVPPPSNSTAFLNNGDSILEDDGADIWLSTYPDYGSPKSGSLTVYYTDSDNCTGENPSTAIEVILITNSKNNPWILRSAYDACPRRNATGFDDPPGAPGTTLISGQNFTYQHSFTVNVTNGLIARVVPIYNNSKIAIRTTNFNLPSQGSNIESVGTSGDTIRKITVFKPWPKIPSELFQYNIFVPKL